MIDTTNMDCEEYTDLLYDLRDGRVKYEDVIWRNNPVETLQNIDYGDIVRIGNNNFVVVSVNNNDGVLFVATLNAFMEIEKSQTYSYSYGNSGWEKISSISEKLGHITLYK